MFKQFKLFILLIIATITGKDKAYIAEIRQRKATALFDTAFEDLQESLKAIDEAVLGTSDRIIEHRQAIHREEKKKQSLIDSYSAIKKRKEKVAELSSF